MESMRAFVRRHPARVAAFVSSAVALIVSAVAPDEPTACRWLCPNCHWKNSCCEGEPL